ncbi:MAG: hypothetical protein AMJ75_09145 [Phycisphaerae bacterium SM1_79]|nr:MAG: hypothetical protein AMJ75_09145 [Phycisphaerae bacterium SM1_79]
MSIADHQKSFQNRAVPRVVSSACDEGKMNWGAGDIFEQNHPMGAEVGNLIVTAGDNEMIIWDGIEKAIWCSPRPCLIPAGKYLPA